MTHALEMDFKPTIRTSRDTISTFEYLISIISGEIHLHRAKNDVSAQMLINRYV